MCGPRPLTSKAPRGEDLPFPRHSGQKARFDCWGISASEWALPWDQLKPACFAVDVWRKSQLRRSVGGKEQSSLRAPEASELLGWIPSE